MELLPSKNWDTETDVVVIGYGGAGAVTAITAFDAGAKVIVLEKTPSLSSLDIKHSRRCTTRISGGGGNTYISMGTVSSPANVSDAANYLFSACGGQTPMDVCEAWAEEVCKNAAWLTKMGIKGHIVKDSPREYASLPGASAMNIFWLKGWGYNTGDGIKMAQKAGADLWHMDVIAGGNCSWFGDPEYDFGISTSAKTDNYLWVNKFGSRYCNESEAWHPHGGWVIHLERTTDYPGYGRIPSYLVFDETAMRAGPIGADEAIRKGGLHMGRRLLPAQLGGYEGWSEDNLKELARGWIKKGDSPGALAAAIGGEMDPALLENSIETYNSYCAKGEDPDFGRSHDKLRPVETPPFYAVPLYPGLVCTCGGPKRSAKAEILDPDGKVIPRLFAAGNCGSVYGRTYSVGSGNLGEVCAFGRIAGRNAAALEPWK